MDDNTNAALADHLASTKGHSVTKASIEAIIAGAEYQRLTPTLTICMLTLANGFVVLGQSACVDPANYNQEIGERIAYDDAFDKIWPLEGYLLATRLMLLRDQGATDRIAALDNELPADGGAVSLDVAVHAPVPFLSFGDSASICHQANQRLRVLLGEAPDQPWPTAPDEQRASAIAGVEFHFVHDGASPSESHENWRAAKIAAGWVWGEVKDPDASPPTHPQLVPYDELPDAQKAKDYLFAGIVHGLRPFIGADVATKPEAPATVPAADPPADPAPALDPAPDVAGDPAPALDPAPDQAAADPEPAADGGADVSRETDPAVASDADLPPRDAAPAREVPETHRQEFDDATALDAAEGGTAHVDAFWNAYDGAASAA